MPQDTVPQKAFPFGDLSADVQGKVLSRLPYSTISRVSRSFRNWGRAEILNHLRRHLSFWLEQDFGFLICCILCHDDPNKSSESIEEGERHLKKVADAICDFTDKPLRFEVPVDSPVYMGLLVKIVGAVHSAVSEFMSSAHHSKTHPTIIVSFQDTHSFKNKFHNIVVEHPVFKLFCPASTESNTSSPLLAELMRMSDPITFSGRTHQVLHVMLDLDSSVYCRFDEVASPREVAALKIQQNHFAIFDTEKRSADHTRASMLCLTHRFSDLAAYIKPSDHASTRFPHLKTLQLKDPSFMRGSLNLISPILLRITHLNTLVLESYINGNIDLSAILHLRSLHLRSRYPIKTSTTIGLPIHLIEFSFLADFHDDLVLSDILTNINHLKHLTTFELETAVNRKHAFPLGQVETSHFTSFVLNGHITTSFHTI